MMMEKIRAGDESFLKSPNMLQGFVNGGVES